MAKRTSILSAVPEQFGKVIAAMQGVIASLNRRLEKLERGPAPRAKPARPRRRGKTRQSPRG